MTKARDVSSRGGLTQVIPTSISVSGGSGSVTANGGISVSGTGGITINGCFTSGYDNYRIMFNSIGSAMLAIYAQTSSAGTANSSSYKWQQVGVLNGGASNSGNNSTTSGELGYISNNGYSGLEFSVLNPFSSAFTTMFGDFIYTAGADFIYRKTCVKHEVASSFDGLRLFVTSGNFTGTIRVYGYNNG